MKFEVLGPLRVEDAGKPLIPSAPKQLQTLALLLLSENRVVSISQLSQELWDGDPPAGAAATVHTYIAQLRKILGAREPAGAERLATTARGYRLAVRPLELDLHLFRHRARAGAEAMATGDNVGGSALLHCALGLWRSGAVVDVQTGPILRALIAAIDRQRVDVLCQRITADLRLGAHRELIGELRWQVCRHPLHEELHVLLMLALYRSGRQADALEVFHRLRRELAAELGVEPRSQVHRMYAAMLTADPRLDPVAEPRMAMSLDHVVTADR